MKTRAMLAIALLATIAKPSHAQVNDVSFTISPTAEYVWWDKDMTIDNNLFWGGKLGFGFGPLLELRGFYLKSSNIKGSARQLNWYNVQSWLGDMQESGILPPCGALGEAGSIEKSSI